MNQDLTYWVTLASMPQMWTRRKNEIYINCFKHEPKITIRQLFEDQSLWQELGLTPEESELFLQAKNELANNSFLVEDLLSQGYNIIPIHSDEYPTTLKQNLKSGAPTVIYTKGNIELLKKPSVAIVGSRNANTESLVFTKNIAKKEVSEGKVIVSGFAKGVDRQALDSALENDGESIIVLPQGITTFSSGYKQYYKHITRGKVLVLSTFHPKAPWSVEFAMARNSIIYGLANTIYAAQSDDKGGTWAGVIDGLRKGREIFVRYPNKDEKNANLLLIQKGAKAVDMTGETISLTAEELMTDEEKAKVQLDNSIKNMLANGVKTSKEILSVLQLNWSDSKMKNHLRKMLDVEEIKIKNKVFFKMKGIMQQTSFAFEDEVPYNAGKSNQKAT